MNKPIFFVFFIFFCLLFNQVSALDVSTNTTQFVTPGQTQKFGYINLSDYTNYTVENTTNATIIEDIQIFVISKFNYILSTNKFDISNESKLVYLNISVPSYYPPENVTDYYFIYYLHNNTIKNIKGNLTYTTQKVENISIVDYKKNVTFKNSESGYLDFNLFNTGNVDFDVFVKTNLSIFETDKYFTLKKQLNNTLQIYYNVPDNYTPESSYVLFNITYQNTSLPLFVNVSVCDEMPPIITYITLKENVFILDIIPIEVEVFDNINTTEVLGEINTPSGEKESVTFTRNESNLWIATYDINEIGMFGVKIIAKDANENNGTNKTFFKSSIRHLVNVYDVIFGRIKVNTEVRDKIMTIDDYTSIHVKMERISLDNCTVMLETKDGNILLVFNTSQVLTNIIGNIYVKVKCAKTGDLSAGINIYTQPSVSSNKDIAEITATFISYEPIKDFKTTWFGNNVSCLGEDTGVWSTSSYRCSILFPADMKFEELVFPVSPQIYQDTKAKWEEDIRDLRVEVKQKEATIGGLVISFWIMIIILILIAIVSFTFIYILPKYFNF